MARGLGFRDDADALRERAERLEAELGARDAELAAREAELAARDAELRDLNVTLTEKERALRAAAGARPGEPRVPLRGALSPQLPQWGWRAWWARADWGQRFAVVFGYAVLGFMVAVSIGGVVSCVVFLTRDAG